MVKRVLLECGCCLARFWAKFGCDCWRSSNCYIRRLLMILLKRGTGYMSYGRMWSILPL